MGGFYVHATYALGETTGNSDGRYTGGRAGYRDGPLNVAIGTLRINYLTGNHTQTMARASYDLGVAPSMVATRKARSTSQPFISV